MTQSFQQLRYLPGHLLRKVGNGFYRGATLVDSLIEKKNPALAKWFADDRDGTRRYTYPDLDQNSIAFDLGGYHGHWASEIYARYRCKIHIFEPVPEYAEIIRTRFRKNPDVTVYQLGLAHETKQIQMGVDQTSSSITRPGKYTIDAQLVQAGDFFRQHQIDQIDVMKINIEGAEYDLLEHLLATGWAARIKNIQVQFHNFMPDARARMNSIQSRLSKTHSLTYQYDFVWENWTLRSK